MAACECLRRFWRRFHTPLRYIFGLLLIIIGLTLLVLPGPGLATIVAGVLILAPKSRFSHWVRRKAHELRERERQWRQHRREKRNGPPDPPRE